MDVCGEKVLKSTTSGTFSGTGTAPDNRLISPAITVGDNTILSFLMACNFAGNAAANITEGGKTHISVSVSPSGDSSPEAFTDVVYEYTPIGLNTWMPVSIDLSAYKGKEIRLLFRCHMNEVFKSAVNNTLYIDNIDLANKKSTDIKVSGLTGLFRGTIAEQPLSVTATNNGATDGGMITGQCYAADFIELMGLEKAMVNVPDAFGEFEDNVFTFPETTCSYQDRNLPTVFTRFADTPKSLTRSNSDNAFRVEFRLGSGSVDFPEAEAETEPEYYNLQGQRLKTPCPGHPVIVRRGSRASKTIIP